MSSGDAFIDDMIETSKAMFTGTISTAPRDTMVDIVDALAPIRVGPCESALGAVQRLVRIHQAIMSDDKPAIFGDVQGDSLEVLRDWLRSVGLGAKITPTELLDLTMSTGRSAHTS
jgi:hypothetical protein